jgi:vacuolar-type H+-ATPase subunit C/Vma6|tara:strand:- start:284 stop:553 length:270 start_codon:yes stop_codon:yes gene_type:complete
VAAILVRTLDPFSFIVILILIGIVYSKKMILPAAIIGAILSETLSAQMNPVYDWGYRIIPGLIASLIQAFIAFYIIKFFKSRKSTTKKN